MKEINIKLTDKTYQQLMEYAEQHFVSNATIAAEFLVAGALEIEKRGGHIPLMLPEPDGGYTGKRITGIIHRNERGEIEHEEE